MAVKKRTTSKNGTPASKDQKKKSPPKKGFQLGVKLKEEIAGLFLIALSVCLILSIASHHTYEQADTIWPLHQAGQLKNVLGLIGAYLSYFLVSYTFGYAVLAVPVLMLAYGWLLLTHKSIFSVNAFAFYLLTLMVLVSVWIAIPATLSQKDHWAFSGLLGGMIARQLYDMLSGFGMAAVWVTLSLVWIVMATRISIADLIPAVRNIFVNMFRGAGDRVQRFRERQRELSDDEQTVTDQIDFPEDKLSKAEKEKPLIPEYLQDKKNLQEKKIIKDEKIPAQSTIPEKYTEQPLTQADAITEIPDNKINVSPPAKNTIPDITVSSVNDRYDTALINDLKALEQITSSISLPEIDFDSLKKSSPPEKNIATEAPKLIPEDVNINQAAVLKLANEDLSVKEIEKKDIELAQSNISDIAKGLFDEEHAGMDMNVRPAAVDKKSDSAESMNDVAPEETEENDNNASGINSIDIDENKNETSEVSEQVEPDKENKTLKPAVKGSAETKPIDFDKANQSARAKYKYPSLELLETTNETEKLSEEDIKVLDEKIHQIINTLAEFGIVTKVVATEYGGPVVAIYQLELPSGLKISKITGLEDELALSMKVKAVRIIPVTAKGTIQVEIPKPRPSPVLIRSLFEDRSFKQSKQKYKLGLALGKDIDGTIHFEDLAKMPHLLIAGTTGSGKSVGINSALTSLLYQFDPSEVKLVLIDPKKVELALYRKLKNHHLICLKNSAGEVIEDVITKPENAKQILKALVEEMEWRYELLAHANVRNIEDYNKRWQDGDLPDDGKYDFCKLEYIITIIDELADLMMTAPREVETSITRLAQMARAVGIHLIVATQRPSVDVLTGLIKANFPARIAYQVRSKIDSRTILDMSGAELLLGRGDMLYLPPGHMPTRIQNAFTSTRETEQIVDYISRMPAFPRKDFVIRDEPKDDNGNDPFGDDFDALYNDALEIVVKYNQGSASLLQRRLSIGYARAARIIDQLERNGVVSAPDGGKPRQVMITASDISAHKI